MSKLFKKGIWLGGEIKRSVLFFAMLILLAFSRVACDDGNSNFKITTVSGARNMPDNELTKLI